jgi:hypothetical protein
VDRKARIIKWASNEFDEKGIVSLIEGMRIFNVGTEVIKKILEQAGYYSTEDGMKKRP